MSSLVERRISNERVDVARNLSSRSSCAGSTHPPEAKNDLSRLSCADSSRPPEDKNYFISSAGDRLHYDGPNRPEVQRRLRPARLGLGLALSPGLGLGLGLALASLEGTSCRPSKCLGIGLGGFTPLILFVISTSRLGLEMFRDRIRGGKPP